jgi:enoyl-CoA hydratase/carnithine racemase
MSPVLYACSARIARITLNRPQRLNAINREMLDALEAALRRAHDDDAAEIVLLTGSGTAFCSGDDLVELAANPPERDGVEAAIDRLQAITRLIMFGPKTVVCAVRGWAIGGGASWPLNADMAIWSETAGIRFPEGLHGLFPSGGATVLLERFCSPHRANEILMLGRPLRGPELVRAGLAGDLIPASEFDERVSACLHGLLALPDGTLSRYKAARIASQRDAVERALQAETRQLTDAIDALIASGHFPDIKRA